MFEKKCLMSALVLAALAASPGVRAGLIGDSVSGSLWANPAMWGSESPQFSPGAVVGAGMEFSGAYRFAPGGVTSQVWDITVDVADSSFTISAHENTAGSNNLKWYTGTLFSVHLGDLDFGTPITGVQLVSGQATWAGYPVLTTSFTGDSIDVAFHNLDFGSGDLPPTGGSWTFDILPQGRSGPVGQEVPEPGSFALAGLALLGLAGTRRRR